MPNSQFRTICVPVDGSPAAHAALEIAIALVGTGGTLTLVNALNRAAVVAECSTPYGGDASIVLDAFEDNQRIVLEEARKQCEASSVNAQTIGLDGSASSAISAFVTDGDFDAVVMGTHARSGLSRLLLGSTAEAVLSSARVPVFVTSEGEHSRLKNGIRSVVVAFDETEPAQAAAQFATAIARDYSAKLAFVHVREDDAERENEASRVMKRACDVAARHGAPCEQVVLDGAAPVTIATAAAARLADLIVIGTHGRHGLTRLRLGSVAAAVIRAATVPVLVIPTEAHVRAEVAQAS